MYRKSLSMVHPQKGLGLPSALFVIVVLSLIVAGIQELNNTSAAAFGREWLSLRALYAAEAGAQVSATYALNTNEAAPVCDSRFIENFTFSDIGLTECQVNVTCDSHVLSGEEYWTLTSTGQCGIANDQATRIVQVRLRL